MLNGKPVMKARNSRNRAGVPALFDQGLLKLPGEVTMPREERSRIMNTRCLVDMRGYKVIITCLHSRDQVKRSS